MLLSYSAFDDVQFELFFPSSIFILSFLFLPRVETYNFPFSDSLTDDTIDLVRNQMLYPLNLYAVFLVGECVNLNEEGRV